MKNIFWASFILICFAPLMGYGQESDMVFPKMRIGITPIAIINTHPAIQLSFDRKITDIWNFSLESAYIFTSEENAKGFRLRPGLETFLARSSWVSCTGGIHLNYRYAIEYIHENTISRNGDFVRWDYNIRNSESRVGLNLSENLLFKLSARLYTEIGSGNWFNGGF